MKLGEKIKEIRKKKISLLKSLQEHLVYLFPHYIDTKTAVSKKYRYRFSEK